MLFICVLRWRMGSEPPPAKFTIAGLEARETVFLSFVKSKVAASSSNASKAEPLSFRDAVQRRVKAKRMIACECNVSDVLRKSLQTTCRSRNRRRVTSECRDWPSDKPHRSTVKGLLSHDQQSTMVKTYIRVLRRLCICIVENTRRRNDRLGYGYRLLGR